MYVVLCLFGFNMYHCRINNVMPRPKTDPLCTTIEICVNDDINLAIEKHRINLLTKDRKVKKYEAAERYFEMVHEFYKKNSVK